MRYLTGINLYLLFFFVFASSTEAATLYIEPNETEIYPGDSIALAVRIDTDEGECINVIDGIIEYDDSILPVDIARGQSIFPFWVEEPIIDKVNKRITFAGGIPNGYCGRIIGDPKLTNIILEIIIQSPGLQIGIGERSPVANVTFGKETKVLLNDGEGTQAPLQAFGTSIFLNKKPRNITIDEWSPRILSDNIFPEDFSISLNSDPSIFAGRYFITFNTTDKQSGLDHYEIIEEPIEEFDLFGWGAVEAPWLEGRSPFLLKDQSLNSTLRVKAVDKAGNEYIAVFVPDESLRGTSSSEYMRTGVYVAGVLILMVLLIVLISTVRRGRKKEMLPEVEELESKR